MPNEYRERKVRPDRLFYLIIRKCGAAFRVIGRLHVCLSVCPRSCSVGRKRPILQNQHGKSEVSEATVVRSLSGKVGRGLVLFVDVSVGLIMAELLDPRHLKDSRRPVSLPLIRGGKSLTASKPSRRRVTVFFLRAGLFACLDRTLHGAFSWRTIVWLCGRLHHITGLCLTGPLSHRAAFQLGGGGEHLYMHGTKRRGFCDPKVCNRWGVLVHFNPIPET